MKATLSSGRRTDGAIQVRSKVDPTFYSPVGSGRSGGGHHGTSLLEKPHIPYQCVGSCLSSTGLDWASRGKNGAPNNVSSQTKNYEIAPFILGRRRDRTIRAPFMPFPEVWRKLLDSFFRGGLKKDLRVSRVGPRGSLNAFFFLLIGVFSQRLIMVRKKGEPSTLGERSTTESCMLRSGRMIRSRKGIS